MPTPERTSLAAIIAAGREILEHSGASGLTMQAIATKVGVRAPSLYKRVRDRDALLTAVAEAILADLTARLTTAASSAQPREALVALAGAYRGFVQEQPESFRLIFTASAPLEALTRAAEPVLHATRDFVGETEALNAARLVTAWMTGFLQMELAGAFRLGGDVDEAFDYGLEHVLTGLGAQVR
jgi:AcrR family transcriptional regulator